MKLKAPLASAVTPGQRTPSLHQLSLSRRSSISAGHGQSAGPTLNVDIGKIGVPVVTPRKERPSHKRSLTGGFAITNQSSWSGSYFPAQNGVSGDEDWTMGDEKTWKTALKADEVDPNDVQGVANSVVRHVTTTRARQAGNLDTVGCSFQGRLTISSRLIKLLLSRCVTSS